MGKNGYYQLENREDGLYLNAKAPQEGGVMPEIDKLAAYCEKKKVEFGSIKELHDAAESACSGTPAKLSDICITPFAGWADYETAQDGMWVKAVFYPPVKGMPEIDYREVIGDLSNKKINYGIDNELINEIVDNQYFFEEFVIVKGKNPVDGYDAVLTYNFDPNPSAKPKMREDGTVDYHQLDNINKIIKDSVVATITPENPGESGYNIYGVEVKPKKVTRKTFKYGKNLKVSEDGYSLISLVTGHVSLQGDKIIVSDEYVVEADVDNSTGDINFGGNVHIRGTVRAGFSVTAEGNIVIDGVVEGAKITAGGNIILQRGIQGMQKGVLRAGGDITANFIESATVHAGGNIETDAILHSTVTAGNSIEVHGKNGYLIGGNVSAGNMVTAKVCGSDMGTSTTVSVGNDPELMAKIAGLKKQMTKHVTDKEQLNRILDMLRKKQQIEGKLDGDKAELMQKTMKNVILLDNTIKQMQREYAECIGMVHDVADARIKITGTVYPGVKLVIGDAVMYVRSKDNFCQYYKEGADVKSKPL